MVCGEKTTNGSQEKSPIIVYHKDVFTEINVLIKLFKLLSGHQKTKYVSPMTNTIIWGNDSHKFIIPIFGINKMLYMFSRQPLLQRISAFG